MKSPLFVFAGAAAATLLLPVQNLAAVGLETYTNRPAFEARLGAGFRRVSFDDVDTATQDPVPFLADRYAESQGILIAAQGGGGQFVSRTFSYPSEFIPVSSPNMYAAGPVGGNNPYTVVTFQASALPATVTGFGLYFLDPDWPDWPEPGLGACNLTVYDGNGAALGGSGTVSGPSGSQQFFGIVTVDSASGGPTPAIAQVVIKAGTGWPTVSSGEGAPMDDFTFGAPVVLMRLSGWTSTEGGLSSLKATGTPGATFRLLSATNLASPVWSVVATNIADAAGIITFTNLPIEGPQRFFRFVTP